MLNETVKKVLKSKDIDISRLNSEKLEGIGIEYDKLYIFKNKIANKEEIVSTDKEVWDYVIKSFELMEFKNNTGSLKGVQIFSVGRWNGIDFKEEDLRNMEENFKVFENVLNIPLKFGHNKKQKMTDGLPAIGWVSNVYFEDGKLKADFENVPSIILNVIDRNLYRSVSVELIKDVSYKGKMFSWVLDAVALLGADAPAVNNLDDLKSYLPDKGNKFSKSERLCFSLKDKEKVMPLLTDEEIKTLQKKQRELEESNLKLEKDNLKFSSDKDSAEKKLKESEELKKKELIEFSRKQVNDLLEKAVKEEKISPAQRETFCKLLYINDDEKVLSLDLKDVENLIGTSNFSKNSKESGKGGKDDNNLQPDELLVSKTYEYMDKHESVTFEKALERVMFTDKDVSRKYVDMHDGGT